jgi:hypothetical protein
MLNVGWRDGKALESEEGKVLGSVSCCYEQKIEADAGSLRR